MWLDNLNRIKKNSGMTIEQISEASGVPKGTLNKLFAGQTKDPQLSTVSAVVHCMGYTLDDLSDDTVSGKIQLTPAQTALLDNFDQLNEEGQTKALDYVEDLVLTGRYKKAAAHGVAAKEAQKITALVSRSGCIVYGGILCSQIMTRSITEGVFPQKIPSNISLNSTNSKKSVTPLSIPTMKINFGQCIITLLVFPANWSISRNV